MNMIKVMSCRFEQCLDMFTMLLVKGSSKMRLFRHLSNYVFGVRNFGYATPMSVILFSQTFKISDAFQKYSKKFRKSFLFLR